MTSSRTVPTEPAAGGETGSPFPEPLRWHIEPLRPWHAPHLAGMRLWLKVHHSRRVRRVLRQKPLLRLLQALPGAGSAVAVAVFADGTRFAFPAYDRYWACYLMADLAYEPDVFAFLARIRDLDYAFLDCGANFGYWSALVSGPGLGGHPALAIEASPDTFALLERTARLNADRFACRQLALVPEPVPSVRFVQGDKHQGRHILGSKPWAKGEPGTIEVPASTLDALVAERFADARHLVVKLDVEGVETEILGHTALLERDNLLFIYEDHGDEADFAATRHLLARGWRIFLWREGRPRRITDPAELAVPGQAIEVGYNLVAAPAALAGRLFAG